MELKAEIVNTAMILLNLLEHCDDEDFVDEIVNAVYENDIAPLWNLEDRLGEDQPDE